jgi:uncharacterized YigZ family protein
MISAFRSQRNFSRLRSRIICMMSGSDMMMRTASTQTLAPGSHQAQIEVKKSKFIAYAKSVESWDEAYLYIMQLKDEHPKARHWCFGFQCGANPVTEQRSGDDGEPTGTAGAPILGAIHGEGLSDVVCVVVRYFGGVKLGTGGLIRAYGGAARLVLREAPVVVLIPKSMVRVKVNSSHIGALYETAAKFEATTTGEEYGADGSLTVNLTVETNNLIKLQKSLTDSTRGEVFVNNI